MSSPPPDPRAWIVDASVAGKWFRPLETEPDGELARDAIGRLAMRITSLTVYEVGNLLGRHAGRNAEQVASALELLLEICGDPIPLLPEDFAATAALTNAHGLSFYDASYVAIASRMGRGVISADGDLLDLGLAVNLDTALQLKTS